MVDRRCDAVEIEGGYDRRRWGYLINDEVNGCRNPEAVEGERRRAETQGRFPDEEGSAGRADRIQNQSKRRRLQSMSSARVRLR